MSPLVPHAVLDEIRLANDIVNVIGSYFQLQRSGSTYKALCPFHKEKTPSFMVNPQRQIFHCFGCGAGGDVFRFVMNYEKVDFMTAVKMLAGKANIRLTFEAGARDDKLAKDVLYEIMAGAAQLYHKILLHNPEAEGARNYLAARALDRKTAAEFMIGYAPDRPDTVIQLAGKKYQRAQLEAAGLILSSAGFSNGNDTGGGHAARWYERFRNRLMFPINDEQGRVVGFSGRILKDDVQVAKYVNTPETALFHKGRLLYALDKARRPIVEQHEAIVCEGQIDVIRCHLAGFNTAVAAQGTAFTDDHARILKRYADGVILAFDADSAGQKAAIHATEIFLRSDLAVRVAVLPKGTDPDTLLRQNEGPSKFRSILERAKSAVDFQIDVLSAETKPDTEAGLKQISSSIL
ncbi:MAG: DNA primase, partial [Kiritimatiellia bacterium]|nr:DNA primase [Kiritimatiellia bacterium]